MELKLFLSAPCVSWKRLAFLNSAARAVLRKAGCFIDGVAVRVGRDFVMEMVAKAPSQFTLTPRNLDRQFQFSNKHLMFSNVASLPNYWDMKLGRKVPGTRKMCPDSIKLSHHFNCMHFVAGYPVELVDIRASLCHLDVLYDKLTRSDKVVHA